jgi:hypothetical protein
VWGGGIRRAENERKARKEGIWYLERMSLALLMDLCDPGINPYRESNEEVTYKLSGRI